MTVRTFSLVVASLVILSGCARVGDSRLNPFNWFGGGETEETAELPVETGDPRPLVAQVTSLVIERIPTGAIVRATGVPPTQGWHTAALVAESDRPVDGVMTYTLRALPPVAPTPVSTVRSRELSVAASVSTVVLGQIRVVRVVAAQNTMVARR